MIEKWRKQLMVGNYTRFMNESIRVTNSVVPRYDQVKKLLAYVKTRAQ